MRLVTVNVNRNENCGDMNLTVIKKMKYIHLYTYDFGVKFDFSSWDLLKMAISPGSRVLEDCAGQSDTLRYVVWGKWPKLYQAMLSWSRGKKKHFIAFKSPLRIINFN